MNANDQPTPIPTPIRPEVILDEARARFQQHQDEKVLEEMRKHEAEKIRLAERWDAVYLQLSDDIHDDALLKSLKVEQTGECEFRFDLSDLQMTLHRYDEYGRSYWRLLGYFTPPESETTSKVNTLVFDGKVEVVRGKVEVVRGKPGWLREWLMVAIGSSLDGKERWLADRESKRARQAEADQKQLEQRNALVTEYQAARAVDAEIRAEIERQKESEREKLWKWPEGFALTYYRLTFQRGAFNSEYQTMSFDYESGYSLTDALDKDGYIEFWSQNGYQVRQIRLDRSLHLPIFERITATSVDQLPGELTEIAETEVKGVTEGYNSIIRQVNPGEDEYLYQRGDEFSMPVSVGAVPVAWLRSHINAITAVEAGVEKRKQESGAV